MKDNLSIVITMLIFVILIVIFPLYNYFERQDDMSYNLALKATTNFVDEVLQAGYMDQEMYDKYTNELSNTGNIYDIQLEGHRKLLTKNANEYNEQFRIDYNDEILNPAENSDITNLNEKKVKGNSYYMNEGDQFYVKLKNDNTTMAGAIFNTIVPTAKKERIVVNYGGVIKNQSWAKVDAVYKGHASISETAPVVKLESINGTNMIQEINDDKLTLYPTNADYVSNIVFSATGPEVNSWFNELESYSWQLDNGIAKIDGKNKKFTIPTLSSGTYKLKINGIDKAGNYSSQRTIEINVTENISGGTSSGGFTNRQELVVGDSPIFLNAFPRGYDLTIYLGNSGHAYGGDEVVIYGTNKEGNITSVNDSSLNVLQRYTLNTKPSSVNMKIVKDESYTYGGKIFDKVFKVNLKCDKINQDNKYKKLVIYYKNQHTNCVLEVSETVGGAYDYKITYGN